MKKYIVFLLLLASCSPKMITHTIQKVKADVATSDGSKMILFVENENILATPTEIDQHKEMVKSIYKQFGGVTSSLPMFVTTSKIFRFGLDKNFWVVDANKMKKRTAMILFDGKNKPIIEYQAEKYPVLINKHFSKDILAKNTALKEKKQQEKEQNKRLDSLLSIRFKPNYRYVQKIINSSVSRYYSIQKCQKCEGRIRTTQYNNNQTNKPVTISYSDYKNGQILSNRIKMLENSNVYQTIYYYSDGSQLLDSIVTTENEKVTSVVRFKYLPDRYICYFDSGLVEEMLFNKKLQIVKKNIYNKNGEIISENQYTYDQYGRLNFEVSFSRGEEESTITYEYKSPSDAIFSKSTIIFQSGDITENSSFSENGKEIFISKTNGKVNHKTISENNFDCQGVFTTYDENGKVISVMISEKI